MVICTHIFLLHSTCISIQIPITLQISLPGLLTFSFLSIICYIAMIAISSRGSLIRPKPREKVVYVAYTLMALAVMELGWYIFSTYAVVAAGVSASATPMSSGSGEMETIGSGVGAGNDMDGASLCSAYRLWVVHFGVLVGLDWICYGLILSTFLFGLDPCGCCLPSVLIKRLISAQEREKEDYIIGMEKSLEDYNKFDSTQGQHVNEINSSLLCSRFRQSCCFCLRRDGLKTSRKNALSDVVDVMRLLFSDIDATYSDLVAGFLLANLYQRKLKAANKNSSAELNRVSCISGE